MFFRIIFLIFLINIKLPATLTKEKYFDFVKALHKNDFTTVGRIVYSLTVVDYLKRIDNSFFTIKAHLLCKETSLNAENNLGINRAYEIEQIQTIRRKIRDEENIEKLREDYNSCCSLQ